MSEPPTRWREWFPWPIGTHWCSYETGLVWILGVYTLFTAIVLVLWALGVIAND